MGCARRARGQTWHTTLKSTASTRTTWDADAILVHNSCGEIVLDKAGNFEQERNKALELLGDIDPATRQPLHRPTRVSSNDVRTVGRVHDSG